MRHHHEEGRGPRGRHGDPSEHGDHGRRGGGRRQRFFGHGELRLIILDILSRSASHGYELIKEIETLTRGNYSPSPGVIYPTLDLLEDQGLISVEDDNGRKKILISEEGKQLHAENRALPISVERLQARMVGCELRRDPQMKRALENFKAVLDLKVNQQASSAAQLKQIIGIIDRAAMEISARLSLFFHHRLPRAGAARTTADRPVYCRQAENLVSSGIKRANSGAMRLNFTQFVFCFAFIPIFTASAELA